MWFQANIKPAAVSWLVKQSWTEVRRGGLKGESGLYGINLKEVDGWHVNTGTNPILTDNHTPGKVSPTDSDWQVEQAVLLHCWMASPHNTRGVIRSCQSNMRWLTMTSLTAAEWTRRCAFIEKLEPQASFREDCFYSSVCFSISNLHFSPTDIGLPKKVHALSFKWWNRRSKRVLH